MASISILGIASIYARFRYPNSAIRLNNPNAWRWGTGLSDFRYDVNGHLQQVLAHGTDNQGRLVTDTSVDRTITYTNDAHGQVLERDDVGSGGALTVTERYYYLDGNRIGDVSNDGPSAVSYAEELAQADRQMGFGQFRYGLPVTSADFDQNYEPINAEYPGKTPTRYTVQDGDTLNSIARALWGDASLWYVIADANGLTGESHLSTGQILSIPNKVANIHNNASTFKVYNAGEAIGDAMPTLPLEPLPPPPPQPGGGCGGIGQLIAIVVAVVVTIYTAGAASEMLGAEVAGGASGGLGGLGVATVTGGVTGGALGSATGVVAAGIGGAVGAAASQGVLIATGDQRGFQWGGVALGAIGAAAGAEVGQYASTISGGSAFTRGAAQAALSNTISQGVGVATGLQQHFDWRGIAAGAIVGGVGGEVGQTDIGKVPVLGNIVGGLASQAAGAMVLGGSMQDRLPQMIGAIAGDTIGEEIGQRLQSQSTSESALYGGAGDVDAMVADATAYNASSPNRFSMPPGNSVSDWLTGQAIDGTNGQILPGGLGGVGSGFVVPETTYSGNTALYGAYGGWVDSGPIEQPSIDPATAASLNLTPDEARNLTMEQAQRSIIDPSLNGPGVDVHAVPYPEISGVPLPEAGSTVGTPGANESSFDAFVRGARGGYAGVLDPSPNAAYAGSLVNDAAQSFKRFGYQMIGAQSADEARAAWNSGHRSLAAAKELQAFGEAGLTLMGVGSAAHAVAGPVMRTVNVAGEYAESFSANLGDKYGMGLRLSVVEGDPAYTGTSDSAVSNKLPTGVTYEGPLYRAVPAGGDPLDISYSVRANGRYTAPGQGGLYWLYAVSRGN